MKKIASKCPTLPWAPGLILSGILFGMVLAGLAQEPGQRDSKPPVKVKRAKRPILKPRDWEGVFFDNLFEEALVGPRPSAGALVEAGRPNGDLTTVNPGTGEGNDSENAWNAVISAEVLETEVKRIQNALETELTTPVQFQTGYLGIRDSFVMLSMWMAIIRDYPGDVRWKEDAAVAQATFARTAANCRVGSDAAFNSARNARDQLREMVRGGTFNSNEIPAEDFSWAQAVDRNPLMRRLEVSLNQLKQRTGQKQDFENEIEEVLHDANVIAAIGRVIADPEMDGGDDEDYVALAGKMIAAANQTTEAVKLQNFDFAATAVNKIEQSCNDCHADWR